MVSIEGLTGIQAFVAAVQTGSFSGASRQLGQTPSGIGKAVSRLEQRLDARLLHRTTRSLSLTDEGLAFYDSCVLALEELQRAQSSLSERRRVPSGRLRVAVPVLLGRYWIAPLLLKLAAQYPALELEMVFSSRAVDFAEEGYDLAVRIGNLEDSTTLAARQIGSQSLVVCASPAYLQAHGQPQSPADLASHACIGTLRNGRVEGWHFSGLPGRTSLLQLPARLRLGDMEAVAAAALDGHGVAQLPGWLVDAQIKTGALVALLQAYQAPGLPIHAVWPASPAMTARVRIVIDLLRESPLPGRASL
ncbi:LysR family transcriptional regulator [Pseudomonas helleri]|uniref:LysR family transcriptional regulator n=1 Tax=Pseudomonas helleri TaxID=1608996 RepID=A0A6A7YHP0_9PSED|nr:LysR family transcriptional regulator [Pseudomonas helleri]MQT32169.1 LysR family transcriptional regulator [Pseudomonas helleri]MQT45773.1 LysR family transcriptional regulator [Pseudomonas helleri]